MSHNCCTLCFYTGNNRVIVSIWQNGRYNKNTFNLKVLHPQHGIYGILCERGEDIVQIMCCWFFLKYCNMTFFSTKAEKMPLAMSLISKEFWANALLTQDSLWSMMLLKYKMFCSFQDKSPCRNKPCGAHGDCFVNTRNYICKWEDGYIGRNCSESELWAL